jgi:hypothetical protein
VSLLVLNNDESAHALGRLVMSLLHAAQNAGDAAPAAEADFPELGGADPYVFWRECGAVALAFCMEKISRLTKAAVSIGDRLRWLFAFGAEISDPILMAAAERQFMAPSPPLPPGVSIPPAGAPRSIIDILSDASVESFLSVE